MLGSINETGEIGAGGLTGISLCVLCRLFDKPFNSASFLRLIFELVLLLLSLLLFDVIDGLILTLTIKRGFSSDGESCVSPLGKGVEGVVGGGGTGVGLAGRLFVSV